MATASVKFENLSLDTMIDAVEQESGIRLTGFASPLPSYINRVYEFNAKDNTRIIAKFYRPGRWSLSALKDEHDFVCGCAAEDIPVVAPLRFNNTETLAKIDGIFFSIYPKRSGREFEVVSEEDWQRIGRLIARIHMVGATADAESRIKIHPETSLSRDIQHLVDGDFISHIHIDSFKRVTSEIFEQITPLFEGIDYIRVHGDCHRANLLYRPDEGMMLIDFDDMAMGPPVQDLWLMLPDHAHKSHREIELLINGYEMFREFDHRTLRLIEPLRAMRIIYFLAWCSTQVDDLKFNHNFPDWGTDNFWRKEINDLNKQLQMIMLHQT